MAASSSTERPAPNQAQPATAPDDATAQPAEDAGHAGELLVEEISIDGMCGVY